MPAVLFATSPVAHAATGPGSIKLHVQSARSVNPGAGFVHKGDPITHYKWLINVDDTGDPGTISNQGTEQVPARHCDRRRHQPRLRRHLPVAVRAQHLGARADRGPGRPDTS